MPSLSHLLLENIHSAAAALLEARGHRVAQRADAPDKSGLIEALHGHDVLGIRSKTSITAEVLDAAPNLMAVGCFCIGTNQVDLEGAASRGVAVFNSPFSNTRSVAELTIAEIIALHRGLFDRSASLHAGEWNKSASDAHEVRGRTLGIVGYGHIGSQLSILAEALGMRVLFHDIAARLPLGNASSVARLHDLLARSDVVSLHVPETPSTRNLIGRDELRAMKRGAHLINNARGGVVDLDALRDALVSGHLGGAALDVYPQEPQQGRAEFRCPLAGLPNVILSPHIGGSTEEAQANIATDVAGKLLRFLENGSTTDAVNMPEVDLPKLRPDQHRILHFHRNVPGVLSKMHRILADAAVNINAEYLQSRGEVSYVILDVDPMHETRIDEHMRTIPETIRMRVLE